MYIRTIKTTLNSRYKINFGRVTRRPRLRGHVPFLACLFPCPRFHGKTCKKCPHFNRTTELTFFHKKFAIQIAREPSLSSSLSRLMRETEFQSKLRVPLFQLRRISKISLASNFTSISASLKMSSYCARLEIPTNIPKLQTTRLVLVTPGFGHILPWP